MLDPVTLFREGGPFMYVLMLFALLGVPVAVLVALLVGGLRLRFPASIGWGLLCLCAGVGLLGTYLGNSMALEAAARASAEMRMKLIANGISVSLYTTIGWQMLVPLGFLGVTGTAWLPALLAPGPDRRLDLPAAGSALGGAAIATLAAFGIIAARIGLGQLFDAGPVVLLLPPVAFLAVVAVVLSSLRISEDRGHRARVAATRVMLGAAAFLGIGIFGEMFAGLGKILAFQAVANASPGDRAEMLQFGLEVAAHARWIGWSFALAPLFAGVGGAGPHLGTLGGRELAGTIVATLQIVFLLGCTLGATLIAQSGMAALF